MTKYIIYGANSLGQALYDYLCHKGIQEYVYCFCDKNADSIAPSPAMLANNASVLTFDQVRSLKMPYVIAASPKTAAAIYAFIKEDSSDAVAFDDVDAWLKEIGADISSDIAAALKDDSLRDTLKTIYEYLNAKERSADAARDRMALAHLPMASSTPTADDRRKTKIRFTFAANFFFNSIRSLILYLADRDDTDLLCVINSKAESYITDGMSESLESMGIACIQSDDYRIEDDLPDIFINNHAHESSLYMAMGGYEKLNEYCRYIAVLPLDGINYGTFPFLAEMYRSVLDPLRYDVIIVNRSIYDMMSALFHNVVCMTNPKFDAIYAKLSHKKQFDRAWDKISNKKVILWAPTHGCFGGLHNRNRICVSYDKYFMDIVDHAAKHNDIALIFRPHIVTVNDLVRQGVWTEEELRSVKRYFADSSNLIWDDSDDYSPAFAVSDAVMTDPGCGILYSYLPTRKPILEMFRDSYAVLWEQNEHLTKNYYRSYDMDGIRAFIEMISRGEDPLCEARMRILEEYIPDFDGKCGQRIGEFILNDFKKKTRNK